MDLFSGRDVTMAAASALRKLPAIEHLLRDPALAPYTTGVPRRIVLDAVRGAVDRARQTLLASPSDNIDEDELRRGILDQARQQISGSVRPHYCRVINATGIILHTALGRAALPRQALQQIQEQLGGYSMVQADIETGLRGGRETRIQWLLQQLTGAEAATVVNNNAAATTIVLNALAAGREVIVSRGQLVEIGGAFRLPEVMAASGVTMIEVGTTNKTHPRDYEQAITPNTAAILRVHPSNYKISGFTSEVPVERLAQIARAHGILLIDDVGAGPLIDFSRFGFAPEPTLQASLQTGADVVTASADKLIGACQGGIILGRAKLIRAVKNSPLARIVRVGKLTLAALEATLVLFLDESRALEEVPTLRLLRRGLPELAEQAERIVARVHQRVPGAAVTTADGFSQMGSGSFPTQNLPTRLVAVGARADKPDAIAADLRRWTPPIFSRIHREQVMLDPRTLLDGEETTVVDAVATILDRKT